MNASCFCAQDAGGAVWSRVHEGYVLDPLLVGATLLVGAPQDPRPWGAPRPGVSR
jgi:hypothetical protein